MSPGQYYHTSAGTYTDGSYLLGSYVGFTQIRYLTVVIKLKCHATLETVTAVLTHLLVSKDLRTEHVFERQCGSSMIHAPPKRHNSVKAVPSHIFQKDQGDKQGSDQCYIPSDL
ncbi:hypothetical protein CHU98_g1643 [Xylaria longipes]|nr:hypothetical protein CHU98_g1643 [Xylaria longipes]